MTIYAITGIRFDEREKHVTHARFGKVNGSNNSWITEPAITEVIKIVDVLVGGDDVFTIFNVDGRSVLGPKLKIITFPDGTENIALDDSNSSVNRTLQELPVC